MSDNIVIVCGGRHYTDKPFVFKTLDAFHKDRPFTFLLEGGATGADALAEQWAEEHDVPHESFPAKWKVWGHRASAQRDLQMLARRPRVVIAFPGDKGTALMVRLAREARVPLIVLAGANR